MQDYIKVQAEDFNVAEEYQSLINNNQKDGAVASFTGLVRDMNDGESVKGLHLEHYPAMAQASLEEIVKQARGRWELGRVRVIHRYGSLSLGEQIVFVGVSSTHRGDSFAACEFIMDFLKTKAPFWKKEQTTSGDRWVEAKNKDEQKVHAWNKEQNEN